MFGILDSGGIPYGLMFGILIGALLPLAFVVRAFWERRGPRHVKAADDWVASKPTSAEDTDDSEDDEEDGDGLIFLAGDVVRDVNQAFRDMIGLAPDALPGADLARFFPADCYSDLKRLMKDRKGIIETQVIKNDGFRRDVEVGVRPAPADRPDLSVVALRDITDRKAAERKNQITVLTDPLTQAGNRVLYHERLRQAIEWAQRSRTCVAVISVGVDRLEDINRRMGYTVGHGVLFAVAERLFAATRRIDTVARIAEAEFAVIATSFSQTKDILTIAHRLQKRLNEPYIVDDKSIDVSPRVGIALYPDDTRVTESLIIFARRAMARATLETTNGLCFFTREMSDILLDRIRLMADLTGALERHEFDPHFDRIFDIRTLEMSGYHASLRWQHPTRGTILPDAFLPVAEVSAEIDRLAEWELEQACAFSMALSTPTTISLGVSPVRLRREDLCQRMVGVITRWQLPPQGLELEIAEKLLESNPDPVFKLLSAFKAAGVRVALVYAMTSNVSLDHHERFTFDTIKLDRSLSAAVDTNAAARKKCAMILALGKSLCIDGVAEGVETRAQFALLAEMGCRRVQGPVLQTIARGGDVMSHAEGLREQA